MSYIPAKSSINGRTVDILNIIRNNASLEYQNDIPAISDVSDIPAVGQSICGNPTRANEFISALINRVALVVAESALFRNPYEALKKGYLEYGESVEEIFIEMAQVEEYSAEKAAAREFKRTIPDVKSVFHLMNWKVMYPITIQQDELKRAFLTAQGVEDLITRIIDSIYTAAAYDEFLLVKYMLIKGVCDGHIKPVDVSSASDIAAIGASFRATSNKFTFPSTEYNLAGVKNSTPKDRQYIFMGADFNATYDVSVLAAAFNMDKADFMGKLLLIDDFTTFDNERWEVIRANCDMVDEVTDTMLGYMEDVVAILIDERYFQIYDEVSTMTDTKVSAGLYWNYFYHNWKIVGTSPFANAAAFIVASVTAVSSMQFKVAGIVDSADSKIYLFNQVIQSGIKDQRFRFIQSEDLIELGIAVDEYGVVTVPVDVFDDEDSVTLTLIAEGGSGGAVELEATLVLNDIAGVGEGAEDTPATKVGDTITFAPGL